MRLSASDLPLPFAVVRQAVEEHGFSQVWQEVLLPRLQEDYRPHTLLSYRKVLEMLLEATQHREVESALSLHDFKHWLEERHHTPSTVRQRLITADLLLLYVTGQRSRQLSRLVADLAPVTPLKTRPYSDAEVERLLALAAPQERLIVLLVLEAALTVQEIATLEKQDVKLASDGMDSHLVLRHDGQPDTRVPLSPALHRELQSWSRENTNASTPFLLRRHSQTHINGVFRSLCRRAGLPVLGLMGLRVTSGARAFSESGSLQTVARHLRIQSIYKAQPYAEAAAFLSTSATDVAAVDSLDSSV